MAQIVFIGLGNMGLPMALNLVRAGHRVTGCDLAAPALAALAQAGGQTAPMAQAVSDPELDVVITALPGPAQVRAVYDQIVPLAPPGTVFIDCSTVDVETARAVAAVVEAAAAGHMMVDSPMSGGVGGATAGTLTFMVGGSEGAFICARPILAAMGRNIFHAGGPGAGAAAKICNNMMLAIQMIAVCEGFNLAERLGLAADKLYAISSTATARCWALNDYCPAPGPVPTAPSNRDYQPGFAAALMLKDLRIAMQAAAAAGAVTPMGAQATQLYALMDQAGQGGADFSAMIRFLGDVR